MNTQPVRLSDGKPRFSLRQYLPFMDWMFNYKRADLSGDLVAGIIVAVMLVPQSMAYAMLAGLPPKIGLYASIVPLLIYALLGTSRALAVGPVAMVSLLVATGIAEMNPANLEETLLIALTLALLIGVIQLAMGLLRVGFLVNFLSHPVLAGFTSAAAIVIGTSQLKHVFGVSIPRAEHFYEQIIAIAERVNEFNPAAIAISLISIIILFFFKLHMADVLKRLNVPEKLRLPLTKVGPLVVVVLGVLVTMLLNLHETANLSIVREVPAGLPALTMPSFDPDMLLALLPTALAISIVSFMESISVAKSLASKRRQKVDANQELVALGAANVGAAFTGAYPVTGGLSRSVVNFTAGANTGLASMITAGIIALTVLFLTPLFFYLPNAVLAAIILVAVTSLLDWKTFAHTWHYNKADAISLIVTFFSVLFIGIEQGILVGAATAMALYLWKTSRPHVAVVGRIEDTEHFRNVLRHDVSTDPDILLVRIDESLYFPNAQYLESLMLGAIADNPQIDHLVLIFSAVNEVDTSALEVLESLHTELHDAGVTLSLAEVKGPVMDKLTRIGFIERLGDDRVFLSTHQACETIKARRAVPTTAIDTTAEPVHA